jgi:hypothetical protein
MIRLDVVNPFSALGSIGIRSRLSVASVVIGHTAIESLASNRSACTTNAGRGLPV